MIPTTGSPTAVPTAAPLVFIGEGTDGGGDQNSGLTRALIVIIFVAVAIALAIVVLAIAVATTRLRRKRRQSSADDSIDAFGATTTPRFGDYDHEFEAIANRLSETGKTMSPYATADIADKARLAVAAARRNLPTPNNGSDPSSPFRRESHLDRSKIRSPFTNGWTARGWAGIGGRAYLAADDGDGGGGGGNTDDPRGSLHGGQPTILFTPTSDDGDGVEAFLHDVGAEPFSPEEKYDSCIPLKLLCFTLPLIALLLLSAIHYMYW